MQKPLFALQTDLDMVIQDLQNLKKGYGTLDYIANEIHHLRLEQDCQGAQMRRIDERLDIIENELKRFDGIERELKKIAAMEEQLRKIASMEEQLRKIAAHLKIK